MRRRAWRVVAVLAFAGALGALWPEADAPGRGTGSETAARAGQGGASARGSGGGTWEALLPRGGPSIRGVVLSFTGAPVPGASIVALPHEEAGTLHQRACTLGSDGTSSKLDGICGVSERQMQELLEEARAEESTSVRTATDAEGRFELSGLREGTHEIWVESPHGVAVLKAATGTEGLRVPLEEGMLIHGVTRGETGRPFTGVTVSLVLLHFVRRFDTVSGADGRFTFGRVPTEEYLLQGLADGLLSELHRVRRDWPDPVTLRLLQPRALEGRVVRHGQGVAGARVRAESLRGELSTLTDAQGHFALPGVPQGSYSLEALAGADIAVASVRLGEGPAEPVLLELQPCAVLEGRVTTEAGAPIANASVHLSAEASSHERFLWTDARGHYRFECVLPGEFGLSLDAEGFQSRNMPIATELDDGRTPRIGPGEVQRRDWALKEAALIAGDIVDAEGRGIPEATVSASPAQSEDEPHLGPPPTTLAAVDKVGHFTLDGLAPGRYDVEVSAEGFHSGGELLQAPTRGVRFVLEREIAPVGVIAGTVVDEQQRPLEGVEVEAAKAPGSYTDNTARTNAAGLFRIRGLKPGTWWLSASHADSNSSEQVHATAEVPVSGPEPVVVRLRLESGLTVSGRVVDEHGAPVAKARVSAFRHESGQVLLGGSATSDAEGRFSLSHLRPGTLFLDVKPQVGVLIEEPDPEGFDTDLPVQADRRSLRSNLVEVRAGDSDVRVELASRRQLRGRVLREDGTPVPRFSVNRRSFDDAEGRFTLDIEPPGRLSFVFRAEELAPAVRVMDLGTDADAALPDVVLRPGRPVHGKVVDAVTGAPLHGAQVSQADNDAIRAVEPLPLDGNVFWVWSREDGSFDMSRVEPGATLSVEQEGYLTGTRRVPDGAGDMVIRLMPEPDASHP